MKRATLVLAVLFLGENLLLCPAAGVFVAKRGGLAWIARQFREAATGHEGPAGNLRLSIFERLPDSPNDIYMVGDSITEMAGDWDELLGYPDVQNRGIGGDTTAGVLDRLTEIVAGHPRAIFLMVGINDLRGGRHVDDIAGQYEQILGRVCSESPETKVYVQSVLPVNEYLYHQYIIPGYPGIHMPGTGEVRELNERLHSLATDAGCTYIDLWPALTDDGCLRTEYTYDGLHVNGFGYAAWTRVLETLVKRACVLRMYSGGHRT